MTNNGIQRTEGRGKNRGKIYYRIQPYLPDGERVTIRLGTGQRRSEKAAKAIRDLIDCRSDNIEPSAETRAWLENNATKAIAEKLREYGLIDELPGRFGESQSPTISVIADEYIRTRGAGLQESTITIFRKARKNLIERFGDIDAANITTADAREFWRWLLEAKGYSENTAKQRLRYARSFFEMAVDDDHIKKNPFRAKGLTVAQSAARKPYVEWEKINRIAEYCPTIEWRLLFVLARSVPMRIPSEIQELTWQDVDWENNQILIRSKKTIRQGKPARIVPIFPAVEPILSQAFDKAAEGQKYVFPNLRQQTNPGVVARKIALRAFVEPWANFFNAIRASAETDLMDQYGLRRACQWAGNSPETAMKNYALVRNTDYVDVGTMGETLNLTGADSATSCALPKAPPLARRAAKSAAELSGTESHRNEKTPEKSGVFEKRRDVANVPMGGIGLEPTTSTMSTWRSSQLS